MTTEPEGDSVSRSARWSRTLALAVTAVFTLQAALTMVAYLDQRSRSMGEVLRVYSAPTWLPGGSAATRVGVIDPATGRATAFGDVVLEAVHPGVTLGAVHDVSGAFGVAHASVSADAVGTVALVAELGPAEDGRRVEAQLRVADDVDWLAERTRFRGEGSARRPNLSVAAGDGPRVRVRDVEGEDPCGIDVSLAVNGGVVAVGLPNRAVVRLTRDGVSVVDRLVQLTGPDGAPTRSARTDVFGSADFEMTVAGAERWTLAYRCDEGSVSRTVDIVPSWDGMVVRPTHAVFASDAQFGFVATHQRTWGEWHQDAYCDGAWLATQTTPILDRVAVLGMPTLRIPERAGGVRLCLLEGYRFLMSPDPPRSVGYFVWAGAGVSQSAAVTALATAFMAHGETALRAQLGATTLAAIDGASSAELERLARWMLDSLPQPFSPIPLAVDGRAAAESAFAAEQDQRLGAMLVALMLDAIVLLLGVFAVLIPGAVRQRAALRAVVLSLDLEDAQDVSGSKRGGIALVVGGLAIGASLLGIVVLLAVLQ